MAADLIAKLKLDSSNWDTQINKSKQSIKKFETDAKGSMGNFDGALKGVGTSLTKFAGFIGIAVTAGETLNKMMESNQTTSDLFHNNLNAAKDSVDLFFKSLTTGDWSAFNNGILGTFDNLKQLSMMIDELADKKLSLGFIRADDLKDVERFEQIAKDTNKTLAERKDAAQNMQGVINHLNKKTKETADFELQTLNQNYASKSGLKIDNEDLKYFAKNTNFSGSLTTEANNAYKTYIKLNAEAAKLKKQFDYEVKNFGFDPTTKNQKKYLDKKKESELFKSENDFLIKQGWLTEENDEARQKTIQTLIEQINLEKEIYGLQKRADETIRGVQTSASSSNKKSSSTDKKNKQNIEIQSLELGINNDIKNQIENGLKPAIQKELDKNKFDFNILLHLNSTEVEADAEELTGSLKDINDKLNAANEAFQYANNDNQRNAIKKQIKEYTAQKAAIEDVTATNDVYGQSMSAVGSLMGSVSSLTDDSTASILGYGANLLNTVATALPQLMSLTTANQATAMSGAISQSQSVPFPMNLVSLAASVAAIIAAFASIPKFASGGVVGGNNFIGDKNLVGINSGEMILNKGQQSRLFSLLDGKQSLNTGINGNVTFKIQGKELIGVLNNYSNKINKY